MGLITQAWINGIYTSLITTLNDSNHKINLSIANPNHTVGSVANASDINTLITDIQKGKNNYYLKTYADCFKNNTALDTVGIGGSILTQTKDQIDKYIDDMLGICANQIKTPGSATGNSTNTTDFRAASGNTNNSVTSDSDVNGNTFRRASGNTNNSVTSDSKSNGNNFRAGNSTNGTNFRAGTCSRGMSNTGRARYGNTFNRSTRTGNTNWTGYSTESNCGFTAGTGDTNCSRTTDSGCTNYSNSPGNSTNSTNFRRASGCTDWSYSPGNSTNATNFRGASGYTNNSNTFVPCVTIRTDFGVYIGGTTVTYVNFA
jgi:hypothetical protein